MTELRELLVHFDAPQIVESACRQTWGESRHDGCLQMIADAIDRGLLVAVDGGGPFIIWNRSYARDLQLTDAGRVFCGIKPATVAVKRVEKTLFD